MHLVVRPAELVDVAPMPSSRGTIGMNSSTVIPVCVGRDDVKHALLARSVKIVLQVVLDRHGLVGLRASSTPDDRRPVAFDAVEREEHLEVQRLLGPQRPVIVERRNALAFGDEVRAPGRRHGLDEVRVIAVFDRPAFHDGSG